MQRRSGLAAELKKSILTSPMLVIGGTTDQPASREHLGMSLTPSADDLCIESPKLQRLYQDWLDRRRRREMPSRRDFDILDLDYILGDLNLFDVLYEPLRFRFRVHGSNAVGRLGFDLTGKTVDDCPDPEYRDLVKGYYTEVVRARLPIRVLRDPYHLRSRVLRWEELILPLSADGQSVDMLLVGISLL
jgi:hypothetical protein